MAKVNVNSATRDEFVEIAGLKPQVADAILRLRAEHGGKVAGLDALKDLARTAGASMDQLRDALDFGAQAAQKSAEITAFAAKSGAETVTLAAKSGAATAAFAAKSGAETAKRAAGNAVEVGQEVARASVDTASRLAAAGVDVAQRTATVAGDAEKQAAERSAETATNVTNLFVSLVSEQMQHNVQVMQSLARVRNWREALEVQNDYFRASVERMTNATGRYVEAVTKLTAGMANLARHEAKKAA
jgi:phasin family protein